MKLSIFQATWCLEDRKHHLVGMKEATSLSWKSASATWPSRTRASPPPAAGPGKLDAAPDPHLLGRLGHQVLAHHFLQRLAGQAAKHEADLINLGPSHFFQAFLNLPSPFLY